MELLGVLLCAVGGVCALAGGIGVIIAAFKKSALWGILCFFLHPAIWVFSFIHWRRAKRPFVLYLGGMVAAVLGLFILEAFSK